MLTSSRDQAGSDGSAAIEDGPEQRRGGEFGVDVSGELTGGGPFLDHADKAAAALSGVAAVELLQAQIAVGSLDQRGNDSGISRRFPAT